jgi:hypothetical protein
MANNWRLRPALVSYPEHLETLNVRSREQNQIAVAQDVIIFYLRFAIT